MVLGMGLLATSLGWSEPVRLEYNGVPIAQEPPPMLVHGRVMVPLRGVMEHFGAIILWNPTTRVVRIETSQVEAFLGVGAPQASVNRRLHRLDVPPIIADGRVMVPLAFVSRTLGATVSWDAPGRRVLIATAQPVPPPPGLVVVPPPGPLPVEDARLAFGLNFEPRLTTVGSMLTMQGATLAGEQVQISLGGQTAQSAREVSPGTYQAQRRLGDADAESDRRMTMLVRLPDRYGMGQSPVAVPMVQPLPNGPALYRVESNGSVPLHAGQRLVVAAQGTPSVTATFTLGRYIFPMLETTPGLYRGEYVVQPDDNVVDARVTVTLTDQNGHHASLDGADPINLTSP
jgi:hypothetical protein